MVYQLVTLSGEFLRTDSNPDTGGVEIWSTAEVMTSLEAKSVLSGNQIFIPLDFEGKFSVPLPATDDLDLLPRDRRFVIQPRLDTGPQEAYQFVLPYRAEGWDLADVVRIPLGYRPTVSWEDHQALLTRVTALEAQITP